MSYASTIFAFLVVLTGTLVSGCFLSREPDTQSTYRKGKDWVKVMQTHPPKKQVLHREKNVALPKSLQKKCYTYLIIVSYRYQ